MESLHKYIKVKSLDFNGNQTKKNLVGHPFIAKKARNAKEALAQRYLGYW